MTEPNKSFWSKITTRWKTFFEIMAEPPVIITLIIAIIATFLSIRPYSDPGVTLIISSIASITAGIFGGIIWDRYKAITEDTILQKKGKSAVRNLSLVAEQLGRLKIRLFSLKDRKEKFPFDEVDHHVITIEKSVISGIEDWVDMVPELKKISEIAQSITQESNKFKETLHEKRELEKALKLKDKTQKKEIEELEEQIKQKDTEISRIEKEISKLRNQQVLISGPTIAAGVSIGTVSPSFDPTASNLFSLDSSKTCQVCGKKYIPGLADFGRCEECANKIL